MKPGSKAFRRLTKPLLLMACLWPFIGLLLGAFEWFGVRLGANPVETILDTCGQWALRFLLVTLAVTPLRQWTGWTELLAYRRMLGLTAFFYALMHFTTYLALDLRFDLAHFTEDLVEHPYVLVGGLALFGLLPLALTSTKGMMRRLGRRWKKLHRLIYPIAILGVWHFYWQVKLDTLEPTVYAVILLVLLAARLVEARRKRARRQRRQVATG